MTERIFNADQEAHMRYLGTIPREQRCKCGWDRLGKCLNPGCKAAYAAATRPGIPVTSLRDSAVQFMASRPCPSRLNDFECPPCQAGREIDRRRAAMVEQVKVTTPCCYVLVIDHPFPEGNVRFEQACVRDEHDEATDHLAGLEVRASFAPDEAVGRWIEKMPG